MQNLRQQKVTAQEMKARKKNTKYGGIFDIL